MSITPAFPSGVTQQQLDSALANRMQIITYIGTGNDSASNPVSVTFRFAPKIFWLFSQNISGDAGRFGDATGNGRTVIPAISLSTSFTLYAGFSSTGDAVQCKSYGKLSNDGKTISWYNSLGTNGYYIFNREGATYMMLGLA